MGGHIEPDEDPIQAVLREVEEESGVAAEVLPTTPSLPFSNIRQLPPPATILIAPVRSCGAARRTGWDGPVEHIDLVYYCRPVADLAGLRTDDPTMRWLTASEVAANVPAAPAPGEPPAALPDDVRVLALEALRVSG
jgi:8-oxo-dGTP pyrophosphatase MutT (NUDIX family)